MGIAETLTGISSGDEDCRPTGLSGSGSVPFRRKKFHRSFLDFFSLGFWNPISPRLGSGIVLGVDVGKAEDRLSSWLLIYEGAERPSVLIGVGRLKPSASFPKRCDRRIARVGPLPRLPVGSLVMAGVSCKDCWPKEVFDCDGVSHLSKTGPGGAEVL
jgi:hypothetical protein